MTYTKEQYEQLINSAKVFSIDRAKDSELWKTEARRLVVFVCEYYKNCVLKKEAFEQYGLELFESIKQAISSFNPDKGIFLHYVNVAFKNRVRQRKLSDALERQRQGISVSASDNKMIKQMLQYVRSKGYDLNDEAILVRIAEKLHTSIEQIRLCIEQSQINFVDDVVVNKKGEQESIFDTIASPIRTAEQNLDENEKQLDVLRRVDNVFQTCQERQKNLLSRLLTSKLIPEMDLTDYVVSHLESISFVDIGMVKGFISGDNMPTARQIATEFEITEQSVSRTLKIFFEKLS